MKIILKKFTPFLFIYLFCLCLNGLAQSVQFTEIARDVGVLYSFIDPHDYGTGVTLYDINNDGNDDLSFGAFEDETLHFYLSYDSVFNATTFTGINLQGYRSKCLMWVDYDNDGDKDLSVTTIEGPLFLYRNNGDDTFTDVSQQSGIGNRIMNAYASAWADYDKDGDLDFYVVNRETSFYGSRNRFFKNNGNGTFDDVSNLIGVYDAQGYGYGVTFLDYNKDGWPDIYIANDKAISKNTLFKNLGNGYFTNVSDSATTGIKMDGMGIAVGDYDNNGYEDLYITNTNQSSPDFGGNVFLKNNGDTTFTDIAEEENLRVFSTGWGTNMVDFNNDALLDIFVSNEGPNEFYQRNRLFIQQQDHHFLEDSTTSIFTTYKRSFSSTVGDINNDGFYDIAVLNTAGENFSIWKSEGNQNNWVKIKLEGTVSNKDAIGSWIELYFNGNKIERYTRCGESFGAQHSNNYIIGTGNATSIDSIFVKWPSSDIIDKYYDVATKQSYLFVENETHLVDTTSTDTTTSDTTAITSIINNNTLNISFSVFPNPTQNTFKVSTENIEGASTLEIFNVKGMLVKRYKLKNAFLLNNTNFDISELPNQPYLIKLSCKEESGIIKIIKQ